MHKTTVYLPAELKAALRRAARARGCPEAELIREAIEALTQGPEAPSPRLPLFRATGAPIAEDVDAFLAEGFGRQ
jgi:hypothetical protein